MNNTQRVFIFRDGVLIEKPEYQTGRHPLEGFAFTEKAIQSLALLSKTDGFELIMITNDAASGAEEGDGEERRMIQEKTIDILRKEGIEFSDVYNAADSIEQEQGSGSEDSLVIGGSEEEIALAKRLNCKAVLFAGTGEGALRSPEISRLCIRVTDSWTSIVSLLLGEDVVLPDRKASVSRKTSETEVSVDVNLDGTGNASVATGLAFLDHMLHQLARHGKMDLAVTASGDLAVDEHHTIEDVAIVLGQAFAQALGDKRGIQRYGFLLPMDDSLAQAAVDFSGRPSFLWDVELHREYVGDLPTDMVHHFFKSFSDEAKCNLSLKASGRNDHHTVEALFKGFAKACRMAVRRDPLDMELPSTKGAL